MANTYAKWDQKFDDFFANNPEREFFIGPVSATDIMLAGVAGWVVGSASAGCPQGAASASYMPTPGSGGALCVIRRPDAKQGRPLPGLFICDGAPPLPPRTSEGSEAEKLARSIWTLAQYSSELGVNFAGRPITVLNS